MNTEIQVINTGDPISIKTWGKSRDGKRYDANIQIDGITFNIEVYYHIGGNSWATYSNVKRGYYVLIKPVIIKTYESDGILCPSLTSSAFTGVKMLLSEASRFSQKGLDMALTSLTPDIIQVLLDQCDVDKFKSKYAADLASA